MVNSRRYKDSIMSFSPASRVFFLLTSLYYPQHLLLPIWPVSWPRPPLFLSSIRSYILQPSVNFSYTVICKYLSKFPLSIYSLAFRLAFFLCDFDPELILESCCRRIRTTCPANCNPLTRLYNTRSVSFYT